MEEDPVAYMCQMMYTCTVNERSPGPLHPLHALCIKRTRQEWTQKYGDKHGRNLERKLDAAFFTHIPTFPTSRKRPLYVMYLSDAQLKTCTQKRVANTVGITSGKETRGKGFDTM